MLLISFLISNKKYNYVSKSYLYVIKQINDHEC